MARIYKRQAAMLIRRPPSAVFSLFRSQMLHAFTAWITDSPTRAEIDAEIAATLSAMRQISEVV